MADPPVIALEDGREAFGSDPGAYAAHRPAYPERVFALLRSRCGLVDGTATFEIGPGTGLATARLLTLGARPLVAIEPDPRLAAHLADALGAASALEVRVEPFEATRLEAGAFDLGAAATSFHWLDQRRALRRVARALRPGGWWAMWWTVFGDPERPDPFHDATKGLLERLGRSPSAGTSGIWPFALEEDVRRADLTGEGLFEDVALDVLRETIRLSAEQVRGLYATFAAVARLPDGERERLLDAIAELAERDFAGRVERHLVFPLYTARRTGAAVGSGEGGVGS